MSLGYADARGRWAPAMRAALAEAKRNWRLLPAKRDGVPIAQWHRLRVTFKLNQQ